MMNDILANITLFQLLYIGIVVTTFIILYGVRSKWYRNMAGQALMASKVTIAVVIWLSLATAVLGPDWPGRFIVRVIIFGGICVSQTWLLVILLKLQSMDHGYTTRFKDPETDEDNTPHVRAAAISGAD